MKFARPRHRPVLFLLVVPCRVLAFPLSYHHDTSTVTYVPLIVISISLFFLLLVFLAIKLVYMKHRRIGTIHAPPGPVRSIPTDSNLSSNTSGFGFGDKQGNGHRGLWVGCFGSPTWETSLMSKLDEAAWRREQRRRSSFGYRLHISSTIRSASTRSKSKNYSSSSRLTKSTVLTSNCSRDTDQRVLPSSSGPSRIALPHGGSSSKALCLVKRNSSAGFHPRYGDFGESHGVRSPGGGFNIARRASPSSIRLVDGPSHSNQVEYSFLSGLPPNTVVASPLIGTRDSFQLSRCSLKCDRKPVPPMPPLPSFLPFCLPNGPENMEPQPLQASEYLPPLRFSPLASTAKVFHSHPQVVEKRAFISRVPDPDENKSDVYSGIPGSDSTSTASSKTQHASNMGLLTGSSVVHVRKTNAKSNHTRLQPCKGLAIGGTSPRTMVAAVLSPLPVEDERCSENESIQTGSSSGSSRSGSVISRKPLKSCLRQNSVVPTPLVCSPDSMLTPWLSETSTQTYTGDSLRTPISDVDIGILGLDRFRWNDEHKELKARSCHTKKDSVALVPNWE